MHNILIIDDDPDICQLLKRFLTKNGYNAEYVGNGKEAMEVLKARTFDLVICDYKLPDITGVELLQKTIILQPNVAIIIITGYSDVKIAVESLRYGAYDYVTKPLHPDEILVTIKNAIASKKKKAEPVSNKPVVRSSDKKEFIFGVSPQSETLQNHIKLIAPTNMSVIIQGETGTGKEFVANAIHQKSSRAGKPFVAIDCGALPKDLAGSELFGHVKGSFTGALTDKIGCIELADTGTLFLDEIGNLTYDNQIKLLRVLQERKIKKLGSNQEVAIDVRIIVATNENLQTAVREQSFRKDLYYRLNEFKIEVFPLRERPEDIPVFANHFLKLSNAELGKNVEGFEQCAMEVLQRYYWHGNLRELQNVVRHAVLLCPRSTIVKSQLPSEIVNPIEDFQEPGLESLDAIDNNNLKKASELAEKQVILNALSKAGNNKTKAARELKIDRKTLYNKLKAYSIHS
ncbi:MAG: sigma-54-dependent Fis family transcriptional regulator [Cyclobacteriaceae bacterium]|nr:sigma-54-dependent Fis family transcriptional regulator [Cyclobacteriaceae bacterium]